MSKEIVSSAWELEKGDHISCPTQAASGMLRHHAIVVKVISDTVVRLIHVTAQQGHNSSSLVLSGAASGHSTPASVKEGNVDIGKLISNGDVYRYKYSPGGCLSPTEVIENARSGLKKEFKYNVFDNNCEHFARWCKTGKMESHQAEKAKKMLSM